MEATEKKIKVTVCVVTYNQEKYIRQCLQSIVDQVTEFYFEVIVADDCSTDGTQAIVKEFADRYQDVVTPIFQEENIGAFKNFVYVHNQANGEYVAHIDGDDFMLPDKLRIQVEELDKNPDCSICVHAMKHFDQRNQRYRKLRPKNIPRKSDISFLLMNLPFFSHSSKMYRAVCNNGIELLTEDVLDCYLHIHHALRGNILYLSDILGVYRLNVGIATAVSCNNSNYYIPNPKMLKLVLEAIEYAGRSGIDVELINKSKAMAYLGTSYNHLMAKDFKMFQMLTTKSYETAKVNNSQLLFKLFSGVPIILFLLLRLRAGLKQII
jgi:glycosyltransferase involved in cell wall biosynthesis